MAKKLPDYKFKEGDLVLVLFEEYIHQPGVSKFQTHDIGPKTDYTKATSWKKAQIEKTGVKDLKKIYFVRLQRKYKTYEKGWVSYDRLQPLIALR